MDDVIGPVTSKDFGKCFGERDTESTVTYLESAPKVANHRPAHALAETRWCTKNWQEDIKTEEWVTKVSKLTQQLVSNSLARQWLHAPASQAEKALAGQLHG